MIFDHLSVILGTSICLALDVRIQILMSTFISIGHFKTVSTARSFVLLISFAYSTMGSRRVKLGRKG